MEHINRLKQLMEEKGLVQTDIAELLGVTRQSVSSYLNLIHPMDADQIVILSKYFNVSSDYLLGLSDLREIIVGDEQVVVDYEIYSTLINEIANLSEQLSICFNNTIYKLRNLIYKSEKENGTEKN